MTTIYLKTTDQPRQIQHHHIPKEFEVRLLADDYSKATDVCLWEIRSLFYTQSELSSKCTFYGTALNKIEAYVLGKELQPDRKIPDVLNPEIEMDYTFDNILSLTLDEAKEIKNTLIDMKSCGFIAQGVIYDNHLFSLSDNAQKNWIVLRMQYDNGTIAHEGDPVRLSLYNHDKYMLARNKIPEFCNLIDSTIQGYLSSGGAIKDLVNSVEITTTELAAIQAVNEIQDNR